MALLAGFIGMSSGAPAAADPVSLTQTYECVFPLIQEDPLTVVIKADLPSAVDVGEPIPAFAVTSVATVSDGAASGLKAVGSATLEGVATADVTVNMPEGPPLDIALENTISSTPLPDPAAEFTVTARGEAPRLTFRQSGTVSIDVNSLLLTMTPRDAAGDKTSLDTFETECTLDPADQGRTLHTIEVLPEPTDRVKLDFDIKGVSHIKAANGDTPLSGDIKTRYDLDTGAFDADLNLAPTRGNFTILGFLPTTADIAFEQDGMTTGTLDVNGVLKSHSEMYVKLTSVNIFGLPIGGGENCRTTEAAKIDLVGEGRFQPYQGGRLVGTYTLPGIADCGGFNDIISAFMAGPGNTIDMNLTHKES
ncbi:DUF6801 domain-containing protein [Streptomyces sp. KLOTTS4A1]|uniref:DUF6801 domain-containing protein n=1 Tax=Streptomyces sp. KLOTTS4A1 TaxID=3390996 RepID=UPI0039F532C2